MPVVDNLHRLPATFQALQPKSNFYPVPAGQFVLAFPKLRPLPGPGSLERILVLTEDGIWGYAPNSDGFLEGENRLRSLQMSGRVHVMFVADTLFVDPKHPKVPITFGRAELYRVYGQFEEFSETVKIILTPQKTLDILQLAESAGDDNYEPPPFVTVSRKDVRILDIERLLPSNISFTNQRFDMDEKKAIFKAWPNLDRIRWAEAYKPCGVEFKKTKISGDEASGQIDLTLGSDKIFEFIGIKLSGNLKSKISSEFHSIESTPNDIELRSKIYSIRNGDDTDLYSFRTMKECEENKINDIILRFRFPNSLERQLDQRVIRDTLRPQTEKWSYDPVNGRFSIECYKRDYISLIQSIEENLAMPIQAVSLLMREVIWVTNKSKFFGC